MSIRRELDVCRPTEIFRVALTLLVSVGFTIALGYRPQYSAASDSVISKDILSFGHLCRDLSADWLRLIEKRRALHIAARELAGLTCWSKIQMRACR